MILSHPSCYRSNNISLILFWTFAPSLRCSRLCSPEMPSPSAPVQLEWGKKKRHYNVVSLQPAAPDRRVGLWVFFFSSPFFPSFSQIKCIVRLESLGVAFCDDGGLGVISDFRRCSGESLFPPTPPRCLFPFCITICVKLRVAAPHLPWNISMY